MAKKTEIKWKLPSTPLQYDERVVLEYLESKDGACGIERTNQAVTFVCFSTRPLHGHASASRALRTLNVMGLVERVRRFGVVYWRRIRFDEEVKVEKGEWVDAKGDDTAIFRSETVCTLFQVLNAKHPEPLDVAFLSRSVGGNPPYHVQETMDGLVRAGYALSNNQVGKKLLYWPSKKGRAYWKTVRKVRDDAEIVLEYLQKHQDEPHMCRYSSIGSEALRLPKELAYQIVVRRVGLIIKELADKGLVYKEKHKVEAWVWVRVKKQPTDNSKE